MEPGKNGTKAGDGAAMVIVSRTARSVVRW
jgi:hypothetical protein